MKLSIHRRRKLREGASYLVRTPINRDEIIFDDEVSDIFQKTLERCKEKYDFEVHNFKVEENYVEFLITPGTDSPLPSIMQWINSVFAKAYNKLKGLSGHVWKHRYVSKIIETITEGIEAFERMFRMSATAILVQDEGDFRHSGRYHYLHKLKSIISYDALTQHLYELCGANA